VRVGVGVRVGVRVGVGVAVGPDVKNAVYVVSETGVEMLWVCAPPSDHDTNVYVVPPGFCGEGAPSVRWMFSTAVIVMGAVNGWPSSVSWRLTGLVWKVS
jgi:hypothetical protein